MVKQLFVKAVTWTVVALLLAPIGRAKSLTPKPVDPNDTWQWQDGRIQVLRQRNLLGEVVAFMDPAGAPPPARHHRIGVLHRDGHFWFVVVGTHATVATRPSLLAILGARHDPRH